MDDVLERAGACRSARAWAYGKSAEEIWRTCDREDWMKWWIERVLTAADVGRVCRHLACDFAEQTLPLYEVAHPADTRPRDVIAVARRYAEGAATAEEMDAAWYVGSAAIMVAKSLANVGAWNAAKNARATSMLCTSNAVRSATMGLTWAEQCAIIRVRFPVMPEFAP